MNRTRYIPAIVAALVLLGSGCKDGPAIRDPSPDSGRAAAQVTADGSTVSLSIVAPPEVEPGEPVRFVLVARNVTARPVYLGTGDSTTTFDVRVRDRAGALVWNRMHGRESLLILMEHTLAPGQELRFADTWDQRSNGGVQIPAGTYEVQGTLDTKEHDDLVTGWKPLAILAPR